MVSVGTQATTKKRLNFYEGLQYGGVYDGEMVLRVAVVAVAWLTGS